VLKLKNSFFKLVENVKINITCVKIKNDIKIHSDKINMFADIKNIREITKSNKILEAKHLLIVMLEFWLYTKSKFFKKFLNESFNFIFNYPSDWGSALATLSANNVGLFNTSNLIGSYNRWSELNDPIEEAG
tara:strand:- start:26 stop:421 length:396 start_codon:yes stop_codon:yes gene_type:complete